MKHFIRLPSCSGHDHIVIWDDTLDDGTVEAFARSLCKYIGGGILRKGEAVFFMGLLAKSVVEAELRESVP